MDTPVPPASSSTDTPIYDELVAMLARRGKPPEPEVVEIVRADGVARLSEDARRVVALAEREAWSLGHCRVGVEHLLLGLLLAGRTVTRELQADGFEWQHLRQAVRCVARSAPSSPLSTALAAQWSTAGPHEPGRTHGGGGTIPASTWTGDAALVFDVARRTAADRGRREATSKDLLTALRLHSSDTSALQAGADPAA